MSFDNNTPSRYRVHLYGRRAALPQFRVKSSWLDEEGNKTISSQALQFPGGYGAAASLVVDFQGYIIQYLVDQAFNCTLSSSAYITLGNKVSFDQDKVQRDWNIMDYLGAWGNSIANAVRNDPSFQEFLIQQLASCGIEASVNTIIEKTNPYFAAMQSFLSNVAFTFQITQSPAFEILIFTISGQEPSDGDKQVQLQSGWNSIYIGTDTPLSQSTIESAGCFSPIAIRFDVASGQLQYESGNLQPGEAYFLNVNGNCTVRLPGSVKPSTTLQLSSGWNFTGVTETVQASQALSACSNANPIIIGVENGALTGVSSSENLQAFRGYLIRSGSSCTAQLRGHGETLPKTEDNVMSSSLVRAQQGPGVSVLRVTSPRNRELSLGSAQQGKSASGNVTIENASLGGSAFDWSVDAGPSWLSVDKSSGTLSPDQQTTISVSAATSNLSQGDHSAILTFRAPNSANKSETVEVSLTVTGSGGGQQDSDGDGINDSNDDCPNQPGPRSNNGCPTGGQDSDGDGINDKNDDCPNQPGPASNNGCPTGGQQDSDGDGIIDQNDDCPNQPGPSSNNGCPTSGGQDSDGDGINDSNDNCPSQPGPPSNNGCPTGGGQQDSDGDGIIDSNDECPNQPEDGNQPDPGDGCPQRDNGGDPPIYGKIQIFPTNEHTFGRDLNGDGSIGQSVLRYRNIETGKVTNTGIVAKSGHANMDIYEDKIAFIGQNGHVQVYDLNTEKVIDTGELGTHPALYGDTLVFESSGWIHYYDLSSQEHVNTHISGHNPVIYGNRIAFERGNPATIHYYNIQTENLVDTDAVGTHPAIYGNLIAFATQEDRINEDLNGNGYADGIEVIRYINLETSTVSNTGAPGNYPVIWDGKIAFSSKESIVGDLNGDGESLGNAIRYYDVNQSRLVNTKTLGTEPDIYQNMISFYEPERWQSIDLTGDGDISDPAVGHIDITDLDRTSNRSTPSSNNASLAQFDTNGNQVIDDPEFLDAMDRWTQGEVSDETFFDVVDAWINETRVSGAEASVAQLSLDSLELAANPAAKTMTFAAQGQAIEGIAVRVFDLHGEQVFAGDTQGQRLTWNFTSSTGQRMANGVYLYVVTVTGPNGETIQSNVRKLALLR